jgi:hypothetical protein
VPSKDPIQRFADIVHNIVLHRLRQAEEAQWGSRVLAAAMVDVPPARFTIARFPSN